MTYRTRDKEAHTSVKKPAHHDNFEMMGAGCAEIPDGPALRRSSRSAGAADSDRNGYIPIRVAVATGHLHVWMTATRISEDDPSCGIWRRRHHNFRTSGLQASGAGEA